MATRTGFAANKAGDPIRKSIGARSEKLPVIGIGTNRFRLDKRDGLREVLQRMAELGGTVIDTAAAYGESEETIGSLLAELKSRDKFFLATKITAPAVGATNALSSVASFERSLSRLKTDRVDLLQVHNLQGTAELLPQLLDWRRAGKIRYLGLTTSRSVQHEQLIAEMNRYPIDFIQVDYSLSNRAAAEHVLPAATKKRVGVLVNLPLGGGRDENLVALAGDVPLPPWAQQLGISSWAQFGLAYVVSHPAVTCAIPGSTQVKHLEDNQRAARIPLLTAATRKQMEDFWDRGMARPKPPA